MTKTGRNVVLFAVNISVKFDVIKIFHLISLQITVLFGRKTGNRLSLEKLHILPHFGHIRERVRDFHTGIFKAVC